MQQGSIRETFSLRHLSDGILLRDLATHAANDRRTTALLVAHIVEVRRRKLYRPAGYPSMYLYLVNALRMSGDVAYKRNQAAKAARQFPAILPAIEDGRLHLTGVVLLEPHLKRDNAECLLAAAVNKTTREIKQLIAERFPRADLPTVVRPIGPQIINAPAIALTGQHFESTATAALELDSNPVARSGLATETPAPQALAVPLRATHAQVAPLAPQRYGVQFTMDEATHELLREVQALLGPAVAPSDIAKVFALALETLKAKLEKQKFGRTERPGKRRGSKDARYVPDAIKREVWARDGGRCTFVGTGGKRCDARETLEYDHVKAVARGGETSAANVRLLCKAHNQFEAERVFGSRFMDGKRARADECAATRAQSGAHASPGSSVRVSSQELG